MSANRGYCVAQLDVFQHGSVYEVAAVGWSRDYRTVRQAIRDSHFGFGKTVVVRNRDGARANPESVLEYERGEIAARDIEWHGGE